MLSSETQVSCMFLLHFLIRSHLFIFKSIHVSSPVSLFISSCTSEQHIFIGNETFHHKSLISDIVECCHGVELGRPHKRWAEDDA